VNTMASLSGLAVGILIGLSAVWLMVALGRIAGVNGIVSGILLERPAGDSAWIVRPGKAEINESKGWDTIGCPTLAGKDQA